MSTRATFLLDGEPLFMVFMDGNPSTYDYRHIPGFPENLVVESHDTDPPDTDIDGVPATLIEARTPARFIRGCIDFVNWYKSSHADDEVEVLQTKNEVTGDDWTYTYWTMENRVFVKCDGKTVLLSKRVT